MIDALNSIESRPVRAAAFAGPAAVAGAGGSAGRDTFARRFAGTALNGAALPGLGDYGRAAAGGMATGISADARVSGPFPDSAGRFPAGSPADSRAAANNRTDTPPVTAESRDTASGVGGGGAASGGDRLSLSPEAEAQLRELKRRDAEVRAHERAHMAAGGQYVAGGPSYEYQQGPDGRQYAIGGHVSIDASSIPDDPDADLAKARQVRRAALAPGEPSAQDRAVAARAAAQESRAARARSEEKAEEGENAPGVDDAAEAADTTNTADAANVANAGVTGGSAASAARDEGSGAAIRGAERATAPDSADSAMWGVPWGDSGRQPWAASLAAVSGARAAETYADMALRGVMPTTLAPGGTGISLSV